MVGERRLPELTGGGVPNTINLHVVSRVVYGVNNICHSLESLIRENGEAGHRKGLKDRVRRRGLKTGPGGLKTKKSYTGALAKSDAKTGKPLLPI